MNTADRDSVDLAGDLLSEDTGSLHHRRYSTGAEINGGEDTTSATAKRASYSSRRNSLSMRREKLTAVDDPLSLLRDSYNATSYHEVDCLTLSSSDELRVINAITETGKKKMVGAVASVDIDFSATGNLRLGVKDLHGGVLVVSVLKRPDGTIGPGELNGIKMGDVILGVNFQACRDGSKSLLKTVKQLNKEDTSTLSLQIWRCQSICTELLPGMVFPKVDDMVIQSFTLFRNKMLSDWERSNFLQSILTYMQNDAEITKKISILKSQNDPELLFPLLKERRAQDNLVLDLERNIFQAKGLRPALSVRIVHTKLAMGDSSSAVVYVLRVEDVESGLQWTAQWRYRDFFQLHQELCEMSYFTKEIPFPRKRLIGLSHVVEERILALEEFVRTAVHVLTSNASMDPGASKALRHIQTFLGVGRYLDCIKPPKMDDQRCIELMTYKHLNDLNSPSCQHCKRFVLTVDLASKVVPGPMGFKPVLDFLCEALQEVEQFTLQNHGQLMTQVLRDRRADLEETQVKAFVRRCVRRQVEAAVYLPLRRTLLRIVYSFIAKRAEKLHKAIEYLRHLSPTYFFLDDAVSECKSLPVAAKAFRDLVQAYLPADQGQLLIKAAITVMVVQTECMGIVNSRDSKSKKPGSLSPSTTCENLNLLQRESRKVRLLDQNTMADPAGTLMSGVGTEVLKSNLQDIDINKLQRQASTGLFDDLDDDDDEPSPVAAVSEDHNRGGGASPPTDVKTPQWHDLISTLTETTMAPNGLKSFPSAFSEGDTSPSAKNTSIFDDPLQGGARDNKPDLLVAASKQSAAASALVTDISTDVRCDSNDRLVTEEYLRSPEFNVEEQSLLGDNSNYDEDAVEGAKVQLTGPKTTEDVLGGNFSASVSQEVDAMRRRTSATVGSGKDRSFSDNVSDVATSAHGSENGEMVEKSTGFYENIDHDAVVSADDFLPMFTYVLVHAHLPQMLLVKELMNSLMDSEEAYGECGYYMATLEAATQHIIDVAEQHGGPNLDQPPPPPENLP